MLSDLYVPSDTHPASPGLSDQSDEENVHSEKMRQKTKRRKKRKILARLISL